MGITGLLPLLKSIHKPCNLKKFSGLTIGVDAYGWLHRGTVACAVELALDGQTTKFVEFAMHRVRMLIHFGVIPYLVFDGDYLPSKAATENERSKKREESKKLGLRLFHAGKLSQAQSELKKAVDVTPEMAKQLIQELKRHDIQYIVAPYEADAQMVYLERENVIQGIISEDSDLLVFGAKRLLTKLDQYGDCVEINRCDFTACKEMSLVGWTDAQFRQMAILSGCDYLSSVNNMGLKTAHQLVRKYKKAEKIIKVLQFNAKYHVPNGYLEKFRKAEMTFLHQRVFCPIANKVIMANALEDTEMENMDFVGKDIEDDIGRAVASGDLHPMTKQPLVCKVPLLKNSPSPWRTGRKQATTVSTPNALKPGKPIENFFKPRRTPLAELDPNSFTPSPTQRQLLEIHGDTWFTSPLVDSPEQAALAASTSLPNLARSATNRSASITSSCPPPKRARLCDDSANRAGDVTPLTETKSRFFGSGLPEPSPSLARKKNAKMNFQILSDDSIEDAMLELPEAAHKSANGKSRLSIFREESRNTSNEPLQDVRGDTQATSSTTTISSFTATTQDSSAELTSQTTATLSRDSTHTSEDTKGLLKKFEHQPDGSGVSGKPAVSEATSSKVRQTSTPLFSRSALQKLVAEGRASPSRLPRPSVPKNTPASPQASAKAAKFGQVRDAPVNQDCIPESPDKIAKLKVVGSEDCLIPNSEDELDQVSEVEAQSPTAQPKANLGRFVYSANRK